MKYELDFLGINEEGKDADAICFRFYDDSLQRYVVGVYDGGFQKYGEKLKDHLNQYYFNTTTSPYIDFVICSHPDQDHASGLTEILENFSVGQLYMNRPWAFIDELYPKISDGLITEHSLENRLREAYPYINQLEELALDRGIPIYDAFQGTKIYEKLTILSPSKEFYIDLLVESEKTPLSETSNANLFKRLANAVQTAIETWTGELLRENVSTTAENETSVILLGDMEKELFLLTGDAGIRSLKRAIDAAPEYGYELTDVKVYQIPHHGGRHNVSPSILDSLVGSKIGDSESPTKTAIVSVSKGSDHPKKMVTNAFIRRGAKVFEARTNILRHSRNMPEREGWVTAKKIEFSETVEDWND